MKFIFCSTPSRMKHKTKAIMDFVMAQGHAPFHPFMAFESERFDMGPIGRENTLEYCCRIIDACDEMWVFGISEGTLIEMQHVSKTRPEAIHLHLEFDPGWQKSYEELKPRYGDLLRGFDLSTNETY